MTRREVSTDWTQTTADNTSEYVNEPHDKARAFTPMEALMSTAPGEPIEASQMEMLALRDVIADAIDALPPRNKWVFEQHVMARVPIRQIADWMQLGKSYVWLLVQESKEMLRESLADHPAIVAYLTRNDYPEDDE